MRRLLIDSFVKAELPIPYTALFHLVENETKKNTK